MELLYFLSGLIFISLLYPILDEIMSLIISWLEVGKAKLNEKINTTNIKIQKDTEACEAEKNIEVTGFGSYQQEEEDFDDDV